MKKIIVRLKGGAGNQLFQLAFSATLASIYKVQCYYIADDISRRDKYNRTLQVKAILDHLCMQEFRPAEQERSLLYLDESDISHPLFTSFMSPLIECPCDLYIEGYFSNYRLHSPEVIEHIKSVLFDMPIHPEIPRSNYIVIHLRELHGSGSSLQNPDIDSLSIDYYKLALKHIFLNQNDSNYNPVAVIFSDLCKSRSSSSLVPMLETCLSALGVKYLYGDDYTSSLMDMANIFRNADYCIIANSTLSWWWAYLSDAVIYSPVMCLWEPDLKIPDSWSQVYAGELYPRTHGKRNHITSPLISSKQLCPRAFSQRRLMFLRLKRGVASRVVNLFTRLANQRVPSFASDLHKLSSIPR